MSTRKLIGKVSATEKNPSSCDEFQFWMSDDTILSPFDIVLVQNKRMTLSHMASFKISFTLQMVRDTSATMFPRILET